MNAVTNVTITTPPFACTACSTSSGTLRGWSQSARAEECEKITGASETRSASSMVAGRDVREVDQHAEPVHLAHHLLAEAREARRGAASSVAESAQSSVCEWVRVM